MFPSIGWLSLFIETAILAKLWADSHEGSVGKPTASGGKWCFASRYLAVDGVPDEPFKPQVKKIESTRIDPHRFQARQADPTYSPKSFHMVCGIGHVHCAKITKTKSSTPYELYSLSNVAASLSISLSFGQLKASQGR